MTLIIIAIDSFKGSLDSRAAGMAVADGLIAGWPRGLDHPVCDILPIADGGEGTIASLAAACGGRLQHGTWRDPVGTDITAAWLRLSDGTTAVIETAAACGLPLMAGRQDILHSDTRGLGQQIRTALDAGASRILVGLGGSATNDGGAGMLQALGARLLDADGHATEPHPHGLARVATVDLSGLHPGLRHAQLEAICDVGNPLLGSRGASAVYGPQKGATPELIPILDAALARWADALEAATGHRGRDLPGAGAAGGLGFALATALRARLRPGIDVMMDACGMSARLRTAQVAITGEGRLDLQSLEGKAPAGVAALAAAAGVPCVAFCGSLGAERTRLCPNPFAAIHEILPRAASLADAIARGAELLTATAQDAAPAIAALAMRAPR